MLIILYGFFINIEKNTTMFSTYQPVTAGFITGLILGDIQTGLFIGGTLQLLSLGISNFGGASIPDYQTASIVSTYITITTGNEPSLGISIGIPVALLMVQIDIIRNMIGIYLVNKAESKAKEYDYSYIGKMQWLGVLLTSATTGIPIALAVLFGPPLVENILQHTPTWLIGGLQVAGGLLPAVGIALLLRYLPTKEYISYLIIGFIFAVYLNISLLGVALFGMSIALIIYKNKTSLQLSQHTIGENEDE